MKLDDKETKILDIVLEYIPYYGEFDLLEKAKSIKNEKFDEVWKNLGNPTEQMIKLQNFLVEHGYAIKRNDLIPSEKFIELKERGRWLKEKGDMKSYLEYQKNKKEKAQNEEIERATAIQRNKQMNRLTFWIAISTGVAALYYLLEVLNHFLGFYCY